MLGLAQLAYSVQTVRRLKASCRRMLAPREAACDDYVVDVTGAPRAYARCLTKVIEMMPGSSFELAALPHAFSSASHATTRIERLLDRKRPSGRLAVMPAMAGSATLAVLAFCTVHALPIATDDPRAGDQRVERMAAAAGDASAPSAAAQAAQAGSVTPRVYDLRIASASMLPTDLPFPRFSPLSRLRDARRTASGASAATPTATATPPAPVTPSASPAPSSPAVAVVSTPLTHGASLDARGTSDTSGAPVTPKRSVPSAAPDMHVMREAMAPKMEATFALGPIVAAGDSEAMPEASESGHIERAWENTRDATSKAMDASGRAVDTATKTAGKATKTAASKAAAGVKAGSTHTVRAFGRVKRTLASVF
jgi:hypothetical protein